MDAGLPAHLPLTGSLRHPAASGNRQTSSSLSLQGRWWPRRVPHPRVGRGSRRRPGQGPRRAQGADAAGPAAAVGRAGGFRRPAGRRPVGRPARRRTSMATLRVYISRLRRALGPGPAPWPRSRPGTGSCSRAGELDAHRFEAPGRRGAGPTWPGGRPEAAAERLREALGPVARPGPVRRGRLRLRAGRTRSGWRRPGWPRSRTGWRRTWPAAATPAWPASWTAWRPAHPLRERLCGQRMLALYRCGRQADALAAYQDLRARLGDELGIDPNPGLQRLQQAILRQDARAGLERPRGARPEPSAGPGRVASCGPAGDRGAAETVLAADGAAGAETGAGRDWAGRGRAGRAGRTGWAAGTAGAAAGPARGRRWLPAETTSFIGRESELATIEELLGLSRLLTLTGPGGSGKTRLALAAAAAGVGPVSGRRVAGRAGPGDRRRTWSPRWRRRRWGSARSRARPLAGQHRRPACATSEALLIVDNCEHVLDAAAEPDQRRCCARCPSLRVLATSQSRLDVAGEATWPVPPLTVPAAGRARIRGWSPQAESVRLLCDRASAGPARVLAGRGQRGQRSARSAAAWTASRSPWSWPRPGSTR